MFSEIKARKAKFGFIARVSISTIYDIGNAVKYSDGKDFSVELKNSGSWAEVKIYANSEALASEFRSLFVERLA